PSLLNQFQPTTRPLQGGQSQQQQQLSGSGTLGGLNHFQAPPSSNSPSSSLSQLAQASGGPSAGLCQTHPSALGSLTGTIAQLHQERPPFAPAAPLQQPGIASPCYTPSGLSPPSQSPVASQPSLPQELAQTLGRHSSPHSSRESVSSFSPFPGGGSGLLGKPCSSVPGRGTLPRQMSSGSLPHPLALAAGGRKESIVLTGDLEPVRSKLPSNL
ncbi:potassium/sodium hyperpolarization-activated cyclic nucleotide-gated channel 4-like, partial [Geospiza fortis]|uniref:Potassium/sodium hyperpolarization-activated cyclic nucleotide-gated channel 4-like n=1 Tax=Geospiza fortis TaxID=48883 RepID=A0A8N5F133_GEOFO